MNKQLPHLNLSLALVLAAGFSAVCGTAAGVFPVATNDAVDYGLSAAFDGTHYLVGIQGDEISDQDVTAQLLSTNGALVGSRIKTGRIGGLPFAASSGTNHLLVWPDKAAPVEHVYGQIIAPSGALAGGAIPIATQSTATVKHCFPVAYGGGKYLVVWNDNRLGSNTAIYGQLLTGAGSLVGGNMLISAPVDGQDEKNPSVAFDGTNFLVVWQFNSTPGGNHNVTYGVFISPSGTIGAPFAIGQSVSLDRNSVNLVFDGTTYLVVWDYDSQLDANGSPIWNLYGRFVTPSGTFPGNEFPIVTQGNPQLASGLAFDGASYLLCWSENIGATNSVVEFQFLNRNGQPMGTIFTPFAGQGANPPMFAGLLFDGNRYATIATLALNPNTSAQMWGLFIPSSLAAPQLSLGPPVGQQWLLSLTGTPGINYAIQASTDPTLANWTAVTTNSPTNGAFSFTDVGATNSSRFYRALRQ